MLKIDLNPYHNSISKNRIIVTVSILVYYQDSYQCFMFTVSFEIQVF